MAVTAPHAQSRKSRATPRPPAPGGTDSARKPSLGEARPRVLYAAQARRVTARGPQGRYVLPGHGRSTRRRTCLGYAGRGTVPGDQPVAVSAADADAAFGGLYAEHGP